MAAKWLRSLSSRSLFPSCLSSCNRQISTIANELNSGKEIYSGMRTSELLRTLLNTHLVGSDLLVDLSVRFLKSPLVRHPILGVPANWVVKHTVYAHFCAGENVEEASATLRRMWELGLQGILDYGSEDATDECSCDANLRGFLQTVHQTSSLPPGSVSFACVKITAIAPLHILQRVSDLLRWQHKSSGFVLPWKKEGLPVLANNSPAYHVLSTPEPLSSEEELSLKLAEERLSALCKACEEFNLPLLVDAEYTSVQPAIDYITYGAAMDFNRRKESPLVYGTIQAYLKDSSSRLLVAVEEAAKRGIPFGVKLVRGAYITRETALASSLGAESPVHATIQDTHACYDHCAALMLQKSAKGDCAIVIATHNFDSGRVAAAKAEELGVAKLQSRLHFAQLKGMADALSLSLVHAGFNVSKYLPFGAVDEVIPYLIRRVEENRGLLRNTAQDRSYIRQELKRRLLHT